MNLVDEVIAEAMLEDGANRRQVTFATGLPEGAVAEIDTLPEGAKPPYRAWTDAEDRYIRAHWQAQTDAEIAEALGRTKSAVHWHRLGLGLRHETAEPDHGDAVYAAILAYKQQHDGNPPTTRRLQETLGLASNSIAHKHVERLEAAGRIERITPVEGGKRRIAVVGARWLPPPNWEAQCKAALGEMPGLAHLAQGLDWARTAESTRAQVYAAILVYKSCCDGNSPTIRWLQEGLGLSSTSLVHHHLGRLEAEGRIARLSPEKYKARIAVVGARWLPPEGGDDAGLD